jgi:CheY-like chemotaxis protein
VGHRASMTGSLLPSTRRLILQPCLMLTSVEPSSALISGDRAPQSMQVKRRPIIAPISYCVGHRRSPEIPMQSDGGFSCFESVNGNDERTPSCFHEEAVGRSPDRFFMTWVLIADNDDELRAQLADALRDRGYEVETTADGAQVVEMLETASETPAVVVLDLLLPRLRGVEVIRAMRRLGRARRVPVIVLSGASIHDDELAGLDVGAVFLKPVAASALFEAIDRACTGSRGGRDDR